MILKSVTSCTPNRISTDIHGKYVIIYVCVAGNTALKRRALIKEKVKEKARFRMNLTSIYLASQNMHLRFRFAVQRKNSISSWFSWSFSIFQLINWEFQSGCVWLQYYPCPSYVVLWFHTVCHQRGKIFEALHVLIFKFCWLVYTKFSTKNVNRKKSTRLK